MGIDWKRADIEGWDIEDVERPRSVVDTCPRCGQASRLVEREKVKNLSLFGVSLVATERGGRVFECTLCHARFDPPEGGVETDEDLDASVIDQLAGLHDQLDKAEEDVALWSARVTIAARSRDAALAKEAQEMVERRTRAAAALRSEVERMGKQLRRGSAADETAPGPTRRALLLPPTASAPSPEASDAPAEPSDAKADDELAALREKVAAKAAVPAKEDELTALKRRLGMISTDAPTASAPPPSPEAPPAVEELPADDEVAQLKKRLRGGAPVATPPAPTEAPPSTDDDLDDLKNKLRPRK